MKKFKLSSLLLAAFLIAGCGTEENSSPSNEENTTEQTEQTEQIEQTEQNDQTEQVEETEQSEQSEQVEETDETGQTEQSEETSGNVETIQEEVVYSGQIDQNSVEVETKDGEPLVLRTQELEGVDFESLEAGQTINVEYHTNENGQNILTSFDPQ